MSKKIGSIAERIAYNYLIDNNLVFLTNNYYTKYGEIDLIMQECNNDFTKNLIFIEVRYRKNNNYGHPIETIDQNKQKKLITSAQCYLSKNPKLSKLQYRFDAVTIISNNTQLINQNNINKINYNNYQIDWFKNIITL